MLITWLDIGEILFETFFSVNFKKKITDVFFKFKHSFDHISGMVGPIDVKRKGSESVG